MSEETRIVKNIGYSFSYSLELQTKIPNETRYPDSATAKGSINGNVDSYDEALEKIQDAKRDLKKLLEVKEDE